MLKRLLVPVIGVALSLSAASAATAGTVEQVERGNLQVFNDVAKTVNRYPLFTIFDDVSAKVHDGVVVLSGAVTMPYKREAIEQRVGKVNGVRQVRNQIEVLPVSGWDDGLRFHVARAIYGHPSFANYSIGPEPSIHIIVKHSRVTLTGVVNNEVDRMLARSLAIGFPAMSVTNNLKTPAEVRDEMEKMN